MFNSAVLKQWPARLLKILKLTAIVVATCGLGILIGYAMMSPSKQMLGGVTGLLAFFLLMTAHPKIGFLVWLTLYPFVGERIYIDLGEGLPDLTLTRFCVGFLTILLLAQIVTGRRPMFKITKVDGAAFAYFIGLTSSTLVAPNPIGAFQYALDTYFMPLLVYFIARNLFEFKEDVDRLINALLILSIYSALYLVLVRLMGVDFLAARASEGMTAYTYGILYVKGLLGGPHVFGLIFAMSLPFVVLRYLNSRSVITRVFYIAAVGLLLAGVFLTFKRGIWLSVLASFLLIQFLSPRFRRFFIILLLVGAVGYAFAAEDLANSAAGTRFNDNLATANGRTERWAAAFELWQQEPLTGYGFWQFSSLTGMNAAENLYLNMLVSAGLVGFLPFLLLLLFTGWDSVTLYRRARRGEYPGIFINWEMVVMCMGTMLSYLVKAYSGNMGAPLPNILFLLLIGAVIESQISTPVDHISVTE